jgi:MFS family permease
MADPRNLLDKVLPPAGLPRQLVVQTAVVAVGWGVYLTGGVVFFRQYVGLSAVQIGVGYSIAGFLTLVVSLPLGHLADRIGGRSAWVAGALVGVVAFASYPLVDGFWSFVLVLGLQTVSQSLTDAGRSVYTAAAVPREIRVRTMAFVRAYLNVGFTVGAGVGAAAIALNSRPGLLILVLANAVGIGVSAFFVARFPTVHAAPPTPTPASIPTPTSASTLAPTSAQGTAPTPAREPRVRPWGVLRDHPYTALASILAALLLNETLFGAIMPLWAVTRTDVPHPALGALFALNTILAVLLQVPATRSAISMLGSARLARLGALATGVACPVFALSGRTHGWSTVLVLALGVVLLTGGELWSAAAQWFFITEVPPPEQRGVYIGAGNTLTGVGKMIGPAALTFLAVRTGGWGWWVIFGFFVLCALAVRPVVAWVGRTPRNGAMFPSPEVSGASGA